MSESRTQRGRVTIKRRGKHVRSLMDGYVVTEHGEARLYGFDADGQEVGIIAIYGLDGWDHIEVDAR